MERIFYSKVDKSYYWMIGATAVVMIYFLWIKMVVLALLFMLVTWWMIQSLTHMKYVVTADDQLRIEVGKPFPPRICSVHEILSVHPCKGSWKSLSLSLEPSICICYEAHQKKRMMIVTPQNAEEFLRVLQKRNPGIRILS